MKVAESPVAREACERVRLEKRPATISLNGRCMVLYSDNLKDGSTFDSMDSEPLWRLDLQGEYRLAGHWVAASQGLEGSLKARPMRSAFVPAFCSSESQRSQIGPSPLRGPHQRSITTCEPPTNGPIPDADSNLNPEVTGPKGFQPA